MLFARRLMLTRVDDDGYLTLQRRVKGNYGRRLFGWASVIAPLIDDDERIRIDFAREILFCSLLLIKDFLFLRYNLLFH